VESRVCICAISAMASSVGAGGGRQNAGETAPLWSEPPLAESEPGQAENAHLSTLRGNKMIPGSLVSMGTCQNDGAPLVQSLSH